MDILAIINTLFAHYQEYRTRRWIAQSYATATGVSMREARIALSDYPN